MKKKTSKLFILVFFETFIFLPYRGILGSSIHGLGWLVPLTIDVKPLLVRIIDLVTTGIETEPST